MLQAAPDRGADMSIPVLVLNQNYEPLNVCSARRAVLLLLSDKAEVIESSPYVLQPSSVAFTCPSVIRLVAQVKRPRPVLRLSRREVFMRDKWTCQYCGIVTRDLTLDHIMPRTRGGAHTWENLVSACKTCNHRKGAKTLDEARLKLRTVPRRPHANPYYYVIRHLNTTPRPEWLPFLGGAESYGQMSA